MRRTIFALFVFTFFQGASSALAEMSLWNRMVWARGFMEDCTRGAGFQKLISQIGERKALHFCACLQVRIPRVFNDDEKGALEIGHLNPDQENRLGHVNGYCLGEALSQQ